MPKRIQRRRTKGWRKPADAVYVGKPTFFGNKHDWQTIGREEAVRRFREDLESDPLFQNAVLRHLSGRDLMCWCPLDSPCHADVLLEFTQRFQNGVHNATSEEA